MSIQQHSPDAPYIADCDSCGARIGHPDEPMFSDLFESRDDAVSGLNAGGWIIDDGTVFCPTCWRDFQYKWSSR